MKGKSQKMTDLLIFDVDGTLAETYTLNLRPHVRDFFRLLLRGGCVQPPRVAIATNQGGVGMRYWMETGGFGKPEKYPTQEQVERRLRALVAALGGDSSIPVYVAYGYRTRAGHLAPVPPEAQQDPHWSAGWRKPEPGMLLQAMADAGASPQETIYVGDSPEDQAAAQAAGCRFAWAADFFTQDWTSCEQIQEIR